MTSNYNLIKFNNKGNVDFKYESTLNKSTEHTIRVIPEKHMYFNKDNSEYVQLDRNNINYLSSGDTIIIHTITGTYWYTVLIEEHTNIPYYLSSGHKIYVTTALNCGNVNKISVRNDIYTHSCYLNQDDVSTAPLKKSIKILSSGTIGSLLNQNNLETIDKIHNDFFDFSLRLPQNIKWQKAWSIYMQYLEELTNPLEAM